MTSSAEPDTAPPDRDPGSAPLPAPARGRGDFRAVVFDIGETVIDKTREYAAWARVLGTTPHTLSAVIGAAVAAGGGAAAAVGSFDPGAWARAPQLYASGALPAPTDDDLYPGVRVTLQRFRDAGWRVAVAGNQPAGYGERLRALQLPADVVATSADWGAAKPARAFFARAVRALLGPDGDPATVVHVGDQIDADVRAASAAGLAAVRVRQGPWGRLQRDPVAEAGCLAVVDRIADVADVLLGGDLHSQRSGEAQSARTPTAGG